MTSLQFLKDIGDLKAPRIKSDKNFTHLIHPYPAKYIPEIPNKLISEFSNERHLVFDPFCGSGTTLLEARLLGRQSLGIDLNPIGVLISRVKTHRLSTADKESISIFRNSLIEDYQRERIKYWVPDIPKIEHWFSKNAILGLSKIVDSIRKVENLHQRRILNLALSNVVVPISNQESETRFAAIKKEITTDTILKLYLNKLDSIVQKLKELSLVEKIINTPCDVYLDNTLNTRKYVKDNSVDLIVTSPPYLNSFDYYLYHKFRVFWLSYPENSSEVSSIAQIQEQELGSRYKFSGKNSDDISVFKSEMTECFRIFNCVLKPSKMLFFVIGDSIVNGSFIKMDQFYDDIASLTGFTKVSQISYAMNGASKSFIATNKNNRHFENKETHILAFQNLNLVKGSKIESPSIIIDSASFKKELPQSSIKVKSLPSKIKKGARYVIDTAKVTEITHGLIKYPAKYIPQIPQWAILNYSQKGDKILDPFNGSGTTSVECLVNHRSFVGLDINPISVLATKVKTTYIPQKTIDTHLTLLKIAVKRLAKSEKVERISFELQEFWFDKAVLNNFFILRTAINSVTNNNVKDFFLVSLSSIIKRISYLDESQIKVKRDHKKLLNGVPDVFELFYKKVEKDKVTIQSLKGFANKGNKIICGSSFKLKKYLGNSERFDLIVTSPPYINAMNYPMYHRYEMMLLGLVEPANYIAHQEDYIGTERVYASDYKIFTPIFPISKTFKSLNEKLKLIYEREPKRYYITQKYFSQMHKFFEQAYKVLKKGKNLVFVCGRNSIKKVDIDTSLELSKIAQFVGFKEVSFFEYEIQKHRFKITRHETAGKINTDVVVILKK